MNNPAQHVNLFRLRQKAPYGTPARRAPVVVSPNPAEPTSMSTVRNTNPAVTSGSGPLYKNAGGSARMKLRIQNGGVPTTYVVSARTGESEQLTDDPASHRSSAVGTIGAIQKEVSQTFTIDRSETLYSTRYLTPQRR